MSRLHEPLKLPVHGKLLEEINQTIVDIKFHDDQSPLMLDKDELEKIRKNHTKHTWQDVCELLRKCYAAINEQREDPLKY